MSETAYFGPCNCCGNVHGGWESGKMATMQDDIAEILRVLGLGDHARPISPHDVVQQEILPHLRRLTGTARRPAPRA